MTRGASNAFETPSKARSGSQRRLLADVDMRTPGRMTTRSSANKAGGERSARLTADSTLISVSAAPTPDFQKLQNSFAAPATIQNAKRRRKGDVDAMAPSSSPSRPDQPEENDADDAVMADEEQEDCGGMSEEVERAMVSRLVVVPLSPAHRSRSSFTYSSLIVTCQHRLQLSTYFFTPTFLTQSKQASGTVFAKLCSDFPAICNNPWMQSSSKRRLRCVECCPFLRILRRQVASWRAERQWRLTPYIAGRAYYRAPQPPGSPSVCVT